MFTAAGPFGPGPIPRSVNGGKRSTYGSYASSIISQDVGPSGASVTDTNSVIGGSSSIAYSQSDRLNGRRAGRRNSFSSVAGTSELGGASTYDDYKSQTEDDADEDVKSQYTGTQSGVTVF
jgi:regulator of nonsense transcripts 1